MCKRCHAFRLEALVASPLPEACPSAEHIHQLCPLELDKLFGSQKVSWVAAPRFLAIFNLKNRAPFRRMPDAIESKALTSGSHYRYRPTIESLSDSSISDSPRISPPRDTESQRTIASEIKGLPLHDTSRADTLPAAVRELRKDLINLRMPESSTTRMEQLGLADVYSASQTPHRVVLAISRLIQNPFFFADEDIIVDYLRSNT